MSAELGSTRAAREAAARFPGSSTHQATRSIKERVQGTGAWMAAIVESAQDAIIGMDLEGTILSWNPAAEALYGYGAPEMIGRSTSALLGPDDDRSMRLALHRLAQGEHVEPFELVRLNSGGIPVVVSLALSPVCNSLGRPIGVSSVEREIVRVPSEMARARRPGNR